MSRMTQPQSELRDSDLVLVTNATGRTGGAAAMQALGRGKRVRAFVRTPGKAEELHKLGAEIAVGDLSDRDAVAAALVGVRRAVLTTPNGPDQVSMEKMFVDAAAAAGVERVVKLSSIDGHRPGRESNSRGDIGPSSSICGFRRSTGRWFELVSTCRISFPVRLGSAPTVS